MCKIFHQNSDVAGIEVKFQALQRAEDIPPWHRRVAATSIV
jgi:hypothetical protein